MAAQAILRHMGDVLPVNQDAAGLHVIETQQRIDQRRFSRAAAPDQADFLARPDMQIQMLDDGQVRSLFGISGHAALIAKTHILEADIAGADRQRPGVGRILHRTGQSEHIHTVGDRADLLEQAAHFPHNPVRHAVEPQSQ